MTPSALPLPPGRGETAPLLARQCATMGYGTIRSAARYSGMLNRLRLWLARGLAGSDHVVISREADRIVLLPGPTLECMRCENQYPLGETGLVKYLSDHGREELRLEQVSTDTRQPRPLISD